MATLLLLPLPRALFLRCLLPGVPPAVAASRSGGR